MGHHFVVVDFADFVDFAGLVQKQASVKDQPTDFHTSLALHRYWPYCFPFDGFALELLVKPAFVAEVATVMRSKPMRYHGL